MSNPSPCDHLVVRIRDALAEDGHVGELGIEVEVRSTPAGDEIVLSGSVSTAERRHEVAAVVNDVLAEHEMSCGVVDLTEVVEAPRPATDEAEVV